MDEADDNGRVEINIWRGLSRSLRETSHLETESDVFPLHRSYEKSRSWLHSPRRTHSVCLGLFILLSMVLDSLARVSSACEKSLLDFWAPAARGSEMILFFLVIRYRAYTHSLENDFVISVREAMLVLPETHIKNGFLAFGTKIQWFVINEVK